MVQRWRSITERIPEVSEKVQDKVRTAIENMTGLTVLDVNIKIAGVSMDENR